MECHPQPKGNGKGKGKGNGGDERWVELRSKALEAHGADTVWYFRNKNQSRLVDGDYYAFSNFYDLRKPFHVTVLDLETGESDGIWYPTSEHAYMAAKTLNLDIRRQISWMRTGAEAKKYCRSEEFKRYQRPDFWNICVNIMEGILRQKFADPQLRKMLLDTGDPYIMEGNLWGDAFWGKVVNSGCLVGSNHLGEILMSLRDEFRREAATQARHRDEEAQAKLQSAHFPSLGQSQVKTASVLAMGQTIPSRAEPFDQESATGTHSVSILLCRAGAQTESSEQKAGLKPEPLAREAAAITARCRRWNREMAMPKDSKAGPLSAPVDPSSGGDKKDTSAPSSASLHDDVFWSPCSRQAQDEILEVRSSVIRDKDVRRLQKALREIDQLELQLEVVVEAGGHLRWNQMQKIARKQEYLDKLQEMAVPASISGGS